MRLNKISLPRLDYKKTTDEIYSFIKRIIEESHASGVIVGLSGGVDSSLVATLCVNALGNDRVLGVLMPAAFTPKEDVEDARKLAKHLMIRSNFAHIQGICDRFFEVFCSEERHLGQKMPRANVYARVRMVILYYYANLYNYLVVGTGDRSEILIGYFTKYGDGGVDFLPILHLYKTQVRELARYVGVPEKISQKPSSPQLYPGHRAIDELPLDYDSLDPVLFGLFDLKLSPKEVSRLTMVRTEIVENVLHRFNMSKHKRAFPPIIKKV